jgi:uncharacterized membrane protein YdjX (TVP38/TMEM64 family)
MNVRSIVSRLLLALALAGAIAWALMHRDQLNPADLQQQIQHLGPWAPLAFIGLFALATVLFLPGAIFGLLGGALFGPVWGSAWNLAGATLGATLAFLTARYVASDWVARRSGGRLQGLIEGVEAEGWRFVAMVRLVPLFPFNLLNYALGLTRIRLSQYVVASAVAMIPGTVAYSARPCRARGRRGQRERDTQCPARTGVAGAGRLLPRLVRRFRRTGPRWIDVRDLQAQLGQGEQTLVIDVRGSDEFSGR